MYVLFYRISICIASCLIFYCRLWSSSHFYYDFNILVKVRLNFCFRLHINLEVFIFLERVIHKSSFDFLIYINIICFYMFLSSFRFKNIKLIRLLFFYALFKSWWEKLFHNKGRSTQFPLLFVIFLQITVTALTPSQVDRIYLPTFLKIDLSRYC